MEPEQRLILSAVLLAVAQQDSGNVRWLGVRPSMVEGLSRAIAKEARGFVGSIDFDEMCDMANVSPDAMRQMDPKKALEAYQRLTSDKWSEDEKV
jgi:hypothetical protein